MNDPKGKPPKLQPLWQYRYVVGRTPPPPKPRGGAEGLPPQEILPAQLEPLRLEHEWRPSLILREFGPARTDQEYLARLVVSVAVFQGVHRILELTEKLLTLFNLGQPRVRSMLADDALKLRKEFLSDLHKRIAGARAELAQTRARAANDLEGEPLSPDGLRLLDLEILADHTETGIMTHEVMARRNTTGLDFGVAVARALPLQRYAEEWVERLFGTAQMHGALLFTPPDYGRVLLVYSDGRLAYDPGADVEAPEG
ncbi:MAG: hypothetical protein IPG45_06890 [Deltaproteobacteria bacterium]|nr:hypothetical protein [Deltaproteobacteria bacterium]